MSTWEDIRLCKNASKNLEKFGNRLYWFVILFKYTLKLEVRYNLLLILLLGARRHKPPSEHPQIEAIRKNKTKT